MTYQTSLMAFLAGTFGLSLTAFAVMAALPAAQSPEGFPGLPVWLVAVWVSASWRSDMSPSPYSCGHWVRCDYSVVGR